MKTNKLLLILGFAVMLQPSVFTEDLPEKEGEVDEQQVKVDKLWEELFNITKHHPNEIEGSMAAGLKVFLKDPQVAVDVLSTLKSSMKTFRMLEKIKKLDAAKKDRAFSALKRFLLSPVRKFLVILHKFKSLIKKPLVQSLAGAGKDAQSSLMCKFLEFTPTGRNQSEKDGKVRSFFDENVESSDILRKTCIEFMIIFSDMVKTAPEVLEIGASVL